jgi:Tfp pilus assembly protein PilN
MIHINLLPEEYRRRARTPIKVTLAVSGVIAANALLLVWFSWLLLGVRAEIESEREVLQTELDGLAPQVAFHKSLESERKSFAAREETLAEITGSRINWTRKVDELVTVINSGGGGERHYVWLDDLNVVQNASDAKSKSAGSVRAAGHSGSDKFDQIANFLEDVERSPFLEDFLPPAPPAGTQSSEDKELIPAVVWSFPLQIEIKTLEQRKADRAKAAGTQKGAPAADKPAGQMDGAAPAEAAPATPTAADPVATPAAAKEGAQ